MNNQTIDLQDLPLTERLTVGRKLSASHGKPVLFMGCTVVDEQRNNAKAKALADAPASYRLAAARTGQSAKSKPKQDTEESAPSGYFDGTGFVTFDDSIAIN